MIPHDLDAETAVVGGCLAFPTSVGDIVDQLTAEDFWSPRNAILWDAIASLHYGGHVIDPVTVADEARRLGGSIDGPEVVALMVDAPGRPRGDHVEIIQRHRLAREALRIAQEATDGLTRGDDPTETVERLRTHLSALDSPLIATTQRARTLDDVVATAEERSPWIIPSVIRRAWRIMLVGAEGRGKSTLTRQIAACAAQGIHPFTLKPMEPIRCVILDPENDAATIAQTGGWLIERLKATVGKRYRPEALHVIERVGGLNLRSRVDRLDVEAELTRLRPELLVIGSLYQTFTKRDRESHEEATEPLLKVLDSWRGRFGCALLIEHHAPQAQGGYREIRPFGSSLFLRWPEIGIALRAQDDGSLNVGRWRGDRLQVNWPSDFRRGRLWPWESEWNEQAGDF